MNINVDPQEVDKFSDDASTWWDPNGPYKTLHEINPLRLSFIEQHASLKGQTVLDVGCGGGILSEALAKAGAMVTGLDANAQAIAAAQQHAQDQQLPINYHHGTLEAFKHPPFDHVVCMELLEHVPDPSSLIAHLAKMLKPSGVLLLSTLNRNLKSFFKAIVAAEYLLKLLPRGTHQYDHFIRPSELDRAAREAGLRLKAIQGLSYQPLSRQYYLSDDVSVNYLAAYQVHE